MQIKDDLDKEIECLVIDNNKNEIEETGYKPPPLIYPRERLKTFNKMLEKDEIKVPGQTPFQPKKKKIGKNCKNEKLKKKKKN